MSAYRFARDEPPFDFEETATAEYMTAKAMPFIHQEDVEYDKAHEDFLQTMFENGWKEGPENFAERTHPDLVAWAELPRKTKDVYAYTAAMVCSAKGFYESLKEDLEEEFIRSFEKPLNLLGGSKRLPLQC